MEHMEPENFPLSAARDLCFRFYHKFRGNLKTVLSIVPLTFAGAQMGWMLYGIGDLTVEVCVLGCETAKPESSNSGK